MPRVNNASSVYQPSQIKRYFDQKLDQSRTLGRSRHVLAVNALDPIFNSPTNNVTLVETYNEGVTLDQMPNQGSPSPFPIENFPGFIPRLYSGPRGALMWIYFGFNSNPDAGGEVQASIDVYTSNDNGENWTNRGRIFESQGSLSSISFVSNNWHLNFPTSNKTYTLQAFDSTQDFSTLSFPVAYPSASHQAIVYDEFQNQEYGRSLYVRTNANEYYYDDSFGGPVASGAPTIYSNSVAFIKDKWVILGTKSDKDKIHLSETIDQRNAFEGTSRTIEFKSAASENPGVFSSSQKVFYFKGTDDWGVVVRIDTFSFTSYEVRVAVFKGTGVGFTWYNGNSIRGISPSSTISFSNDRLTGSVLMYINDEATGTHTFYALEENPSVGIDVGFVQKSEIVDSTVRFYLAENVSPTIVDNFNMIANPRFYQGLQGWQIRPAVTNGQKNYQWNSPYDATIVLKNTVKIANEVKNLTPGNRYFYKFNLQTNGASASAAINHGGVLSSPTTVDNPFNATFGTLASNAFGSQVAVNTTRHAGSSPTRTNFGATSSGQVGLFNSSTNTLVHGNATAIRTGETNADFGTSMDMCESYLIVGAPGSTVNSKADTGRAYIYSTVDGSLLFTLENPAPTTPASFGDEFGCSVSICESYAIVGARNDYGNTNTVSTGRAYIFSTADGSLLYTLENPNTYSTGVQDFFGTAVAITESYAIVSAPSEDTENRSFTRIDNVGAAYIYSTATGQRIHNLVNPSPTTNSRFGSALDICESYAVVVGGGNCYVYDPVSGTRLHTLTNPNVNTASASDGFGTSVSITDRYLVVGAPSEDEGTNTNYNTGVAYVYDSSTGALRHTLVNPSTYSSGFLDIFGTSVAISEPDAAGTVKLIVGAPGEDQSGASESGKAYVYTISESNLLSQVTDFSSVANYFTATSNSITLEFDAQASGGTDVLLQNVAVTDITNLDITNPLVALNLETSSINTVYTSSNFEDWTARTLPQTATWSWLARGKVDNEQDLMLIGTNGEVCVSTDSGVSWSSASNLPALRVAGTWHQVVNVYSTALGGSNWVAITKPTTGTTTQYAFSDDLGTTWTDSDFPVAAAWDYVDSYVYYDGTSTASQVMAHSNASGTLLRNFNGGVSGSWSDITPVTSIVSSINPKYAKIEYIGTQYNGSSSSWEVGFVKIVPSSTSAVAYSYSSDGGTTWTNSTSTILNANLNASNNLYYTYFSADFNNIAMVQRSNATSYKNGDFPTASWSSTSNAFDTSPFFDFVTTVDNRFAVAGGRSSQLYINPKYTSIWIPMTGFPANMKLVL